MVDVSEIPFEGVQIIGTGLLGTSLGLVLSEKGVKVWLDDQSPSTRALAADYGAGVAEPAPAHDVDLVVVATPPDVTADVVSGALVDFPNAIVMDVASVKATIEDTLNQSGADLTRYVGTHPMAGREKGGPTSARADLFTARPWVICANPHAGRAMLARVTELVLACGATVHHMTAQDHDKAVAMVSHVPQLVSSVLAGALLDATDKELELAGQGVRDVTRVAGSDPGLWIQILEHNSGFVSEILAGVADDLATASQALQDPDAKGATKTLAEILSAGVSGVARLPGKHGMSKRFASLTVVIDDRPGQLAAVLTDVGDIGVNLEDMRLEHSPGAAVGFVELSVQPERVHELADALVERGWKIAGERS